MALMQTKQITTAGDRSSTMRGLDIFRGDGGIIEHLCAGGELVAAQLPSASHWTPEHRLAAAVLASALVEVREHRGNPVYRRRISQDLEWIQSDDTEWPFSFVPLCQLLGIEPNYARATVERWLAIPEEQESTASSGQLCAA